MARQRATPVPKTFALEEALRERLELYCALSGDHPLDVIEDAIAEHLEVLEALPAADLAGGTLEVLISSDDGAAP